MTDEKTVEQIIEERRARREQSSQPSTTGTAPVDPENKSIEQLREERRKRRGVTL